jgi:hypothetical protein
MSERANEQLSGGGPVTEDHREINPATGMQKGYIVLTAEERAKGFCRPVRRTYVHVGRPAPKHPLRDLTAAEQDLYEGSGYVQFEVYPQGDTPKLGGPMVGRFWRQADIDRIGKGCGVATTMAQDIAETYARKPDFYGGTFCVGCGKHLPVGEQGEFVWDGTDERVGT